MVTEYAVISPLLGAMFAGLGGKFLGRTVSHRLTILGVGLSAICCAILTKWIFVDHWPVFDQAAYTWMHSGGFHFSIGFLIDRLSVLMMLMITSISLLIHIYSIGYMEEDPGYQRFFSYMSLFTFAMLMLVSGNNLLQLFFGWEGVGVVSYLLIGFWFKKESASEASLRAFIVNRVGDFGFILGIAMIFALVGSIDYAPVFAKASSLLGHTFAFSSHGHVTSVTLICLLLFIGAMGKSAQIPLHVWLPGSMEGPTPISALIHAATMVTAGIYMVARMSPLFELSPTALSVVLVIGASGALWLGLIGIVQNDIKRVIAYSTMSQLGYMIAGTGASAYAAGMFHLFTHAFFKALLFLGAGSVIVALHHEQNIHKMGNLKRYMPITYITFLIGSLSLAAIPPFSGFYSKDAIIEAVRHADLPGAGYAYLCLLVGAFVTALYSFRLLFVVFHGKEHLAHPEKVKESCWQITLPLIVLAVPAAVIGLLFAQSMLYSNTPLLGSAIYMNAEHQGFMAELAAEYQGWLSAAMDALKGLPFWFSVAGVVTAWVSYLLYPAIPEIVSQRLRLPYQILVHRYGINQFYHWVFVRGGRALSGFLYQFADMTVIDAWMVNGSAKGVGRLSMLLKRLQSGYLYHYAFAMILGVVVLLSWMMWVR